MEISSFKRDFFAGFNGRRSKKVERKFGFLDVKNCEKLDLDFLRMQFQPKIASYKLDRLNESQIELYQTEYFIGAMDSYNKSINNYKNYFNLQQFLGFYNYISLFFSSDVEFEFYLDNTWKSIYRKEDYEELTDRELRLK